MGRVVAQGDTRPMAASREAMDDLRRILDGRAAFYSKADATLDTSRTHRGAELRRARCGSSPAPDEDAANCARRLNTFA